LKAQRWSITQVEFINAKAKLLDRLHGQINGRKEMTLLRMFAEGARGFQDGLSAGDYSTVTGASPVTITRNLKDLTQKGALIWTGERKHARDVIILSPK
jgi:Fic family protein